MFFKIIFIVLIMKIQLGYLYQFGEIQKSIHRKCSEGKFHCTAVKQVVYLSCFIVKRSYDNIKKCLYSRQWYRLASTLYNYTDEVVINNKWFEWLGLHRNSSIVNRPYIYTFFPWNLLKVKNTL